MANSIVTVTVTQQQAPAPNQLQKTGAMISQGGTNLAAGTAALLTQFDDLTPLLALALDITSITWAAGVATVTTVAPHNITVNEIFPTTIAGALPAGYNGTFFATATGASQFTYSLATNPGASPATTPGTFTPRNQGELVAMVTDFFSQGATQACYVLELGAGSPAAGVTALSAYINANPGFFYSYLVPRSWDGLPAFLAFLNEFTSTTAKTYFFVTTTLQNYGLYSALLKDVIALVESPAMDSFLANPLTALSWASTNAQATASTTTNHGVSPGTYFTIAGVTPVGYNGTFLALPGTTGNILVYSIPSDPGAESVLGTLQAQTYANTGVPATEFSHASDWWVTLNYNPSTTNKVPPFAFSFLFDVTPFPTKGMGAVISELKAASINYVGTGAEGGISDAILLWGHTLDNRPFNYWYSADWMQINIQLAVSNEVINGSNNPVNPLYYDQDGINRLQQRALSTASSGVSFGLVLGRPIQTGLDGPVFNQNLNAGLYAGNVVINAVPFVAYTSENPSDDRLGIYKGLSVVFTPLRGFEAILVNLVVTDFVSA